MTEIIEMEQTSFEEELPPVSDHVERANIGEEENTTFVEEIPNVMPYSMDCSQIVEDQKTTFEAVVASVIPDPMELDSIANMEHTNEKLDDDNEKLAAEIGGNDENIRGLVENHYIAVDVQHTIMPKEAEEVNVDEKAAFEMGDVKDNKESVAEIEDNIDGDLQQAMSSEDMQEIDVDLMSAVEGPNASSDSPIVPSNINPEINDSVRPPTFEENNLVGVQIGLQPLPLPEEEQTPEDYVTRSVRIAKADIGSKTSPLPEKDDTAAEIVAKSVKKSKAAIEKKDTETKEVGSPTLNSCNRSLRSCKSQTITISNKQTNIPLLNSRNRPRKISDKQIPNISNNHTMKPTEVLCTLLRLLPLKTVFIVRPVDDYKKNRSVVHELNISKLLKKNITDLDFDSLLYACGFLTVDPKDGKFKFKNMMLERALSAHNIDGSVMNSKPRGKKRQTTIIIKSKDGDIQPGYEEQCRGAIRIAKAEFGRAKKRKFSRAPKEVRRKSFRLQSQPDMEEPDLQQQPSPSLLLQHPAPQLPVPPPPPPKKSWVEKKMEEAANLDFTLNPRPILKLNAYIPLSKPHILSEKLKILIVTTALRFGYDRDTAHKQKANIICAVLRLIYYMHGLPEPPSYSLSAHELIDTYIEATELDRPVLLPLG